MRSIEFEYVYDSDSGNSSYSYSKERLTKYQEDALAKEISKQQSKLILSGSGIFCPAEKIRGLEGVSFRYKHIPLPNRRSVAFSMYYSDEHEDKYIDNVDRNIIGSIPSSEKIEQHGWIDTYIDLLSKDLDLIASSSDRAEKKALDYTLEELKLFLNDTPQSSTLLLFSAYLHFSMTHLMDIDRAKASLFELSARSIANRTETSCCNLRTIEYNDQGVDSNNKNRNIFVKLFNYFSLSK